MKAPVELWTVARCLGELLGEVVFVGGMIRELLVSDPAASAARPTKDVDCIIDAVSWVDYARLSERLRSMGFSDCMDEGAPICRWVVRDILVDLMPIDPAVLGFSNVWYPSTVEHASTIQGPDGAIRIANAPHFCATKLEAFLGRGEGDFLHHDIEDFMAVVDGRAELLGEVQQAPQDIREFVGEQVSEWLQDKSFLESLLSHLEGDDASQARRPLLLSRLQSIAAFRGAEQPPASDAAPGRPPLVGAAESALTAPGRRTAASGVPGGKSSSGPAISARRPTMRRATF